MMKHLMACLLILASFSACTNPRYIRPESQPGYDGVKAVMAGSREQVRECYLQLLAADPKAHGRIVADFRIGTNGKVTALNFIEQDFRNPALEQCLSKVIYSLQFAPDPNVQPVKYPFVFQKND
jgi:hypothetical protein